MPPDVPILLTLLLAAVSPWWHGAARRSFIAAGVLLHGCSVWVFGRELAAVAGGAAPTRSSWGHLFPTDLVTGAFSANAWSLVFALMVSGVGLLIFLYAQGYFGDSPKGLRFFAALLAFEASMLGVVLADDAVMVFLFWELTSVTSFFLIGFLHEEKESRWNALQALLVTGLGGVAMLAGFLMLGHHWGTLSMIGWREQVAAGSGPPLAAMILILLGAMTKSAQFPFFFWLPNAMSAPTPVSAYLHSATMVKAGIYLIGALLPLFAMHPPLMMVIMVAGGLTALTGVTLGWVQTDLKKILAYTTLSVLGMLALLLGVGSTAAIQAAVLVMIAHVCYKAGLFMMAGAVDKATGTRDVRVLGGLRTSLPLLTGCSVLLVLSTCGVMPLLGFLGKEYAYKMGLAGSMQNYAVLAVLFVVNVGLMALALRAAWSPFRGGEMNPAKVKKVSPLMILGPAVLAVAGLVLGVLAPSVLTPVVGKVVGHIADEEFSYALKLWHGPNLALLLSVLTLACGWLLYRSCAPHGGANVLTKTLGGCEGFYGMCHNGLMSGSKKITDRIQNGNVNSYLRWLLFSLLVLVTAFWYASYRAGNPIVTVPDRGSEITWIEWCMVPAMAFFLWMTMTTRSRIFALLSLAIIGLGVAFLFARMGAPDVALTLLLVETLTVILFMRVVRGLPRLRGPMPGHRRVLDVSLACAVGTLMTLLTLKIAEVQTHPTIASTLSEWSLPLAKGRNIVNVILVDFRALDTLGEITVVALAAVGVSILWRRDPTRAAKPTNPPAP
jgi:multicomponent Na+:H+ antiporter subunit A